jgi:hypothetical protein
MDRPLRRAGRPGQFGTPEQGIFAYWVNAHLHRRPLRYIGFDGTGKQVRDALHPRDLAALLDLQMRRERTGGQRIYTAGGGPENAMSLAQLTAWCDARFGRFRGQRRQERTAVRHSVGGDGQRRMRASLRLAAGYAHQGAAGRDRAARRGESRLAGAERFVKAPPPASKEPLRLLSVVIPCRNEEGAIASSVEHLHVELRLHGVEHEIVTVDDGSTDSTWPVMQKLSDRVPTFSGRCRIPVSTVWPRGDLRASTTAEGDAVVIMMADESDDCRDVVRYWELLGEGYDAVFGSRFVRGGGVIDYPAHKLLINRMANLFLRLLFHVR